MGQNGTFAVRCYGWLRLSSEQLYAASKLFQTYELGPWGIMKDFEEINTTTEHIPSILEKLDIAYKAKIVLDDLRPENYKESRMLDLGTTRTYPHPVWSDREFEWCHSHYRRGIEEWVFVKNHFEIVLPPIK